MAPAPRKNSQKGTQEIDHKNTRKRFTAEGAEGAERMRRGERGERGETN
jgi:hypothetical protein